MLVLTRRAGTVVRIHVPPCETGKVIDVTIVEVRQNNVRIGIDAPPSVRIVRAEIEESDSE